MLKNTDWHFVLFFFVCFFFFCFCFFRSKYTSADKRALALLSYLSRTNPDLRSGGPGFRRIISLLSCVPYSVPWKQLAIHIMHTEVTRTKSNSVAFLDLCFYCSSWSVACIVIRIRVFGYLASCIVSFSDHRPCQGLERKQFIVIGQRKDNRIIYRLLKVLHFLFPPQTTWHSKGNFPASVCS